jgi:acyl-coenzyme A thioesterase PaaI-like protein
MSDQPEPPNIAHFSSVPWCRRLLSDPTYLVIPSRSRHVKKDGEDALTGGTINTPGTISAWLTMYKKPSSEDESIRELRALLTLGSALDGYPHICHGGIQATILDEVMGNLVGVNKDRVYHKALAAGEDAERSPTVTAELTVKYLRPVPTPSTVCVVVRITRSEGRKVWIDGTIEDGVGTALASASGLFVHVRTQKM